MSSGNPRLGEVEPRERAGAQTSRKYEYQYERTARAVLELLADGSQHICVYCDWHDDYVAEIGAPLSRYMFHQVKGRKSSQGPWKFAEFFGVGKKKAAKPKTPPATVATDAIVPLMLLHYQNFGNNCAGLAFVTNAGLDPPLSEFIKNLGDAIDETHLSGETRSAFQHVAGAYVAATPPLAGSEAQLFSWLRGLRIHTDQGNLENADAALLELAAAVEEHSEIDLRQRQAKQIAREIVSHVRTKVGHSTTVVPTTDEKLRRDKGIVIAELLNMLSLSSQAFEELRAGQGRETVKTLSRLERFCRNKGLSSQIVQICTYKAGWDVWRTVERHFLTSTDYMLLETKAGDLLRADFPIAKLVTEAKDIAKQFSGVTATRLSPEHVLGLVFSLAADTEALKYTKGGL